MLLFFLPVLWMVLTSFHTESDAATNPPQFIAPLTLSGYKEFFAPAGQPVAAADQLGHGQRSCSTVLVLLLAIPAAYALSIRPVRKWTDVMFFFLSTKMLPVGGRHPADLPDRPELHVLDNIWLLVILYTSMNLPIAVWMMRSFLAEVPAGDPRGGADRRRRAAAPSAPGSSRRSPCRESRRPR